MRALRGWPGRTKRCATYRTDTETGARLLGQVDALDDAGEVPFPLEAESVSIVRDIVGDLAQELLTSRTHWFKLQVATVTRCPILMSSRLASCWPFQRENEHESEAQFGFRKHPPALSLQARVLLFQKRLMTPAARYGVGRGSV